MAMSESTVIRDAQPGADDDAVVLLMTDYMTWAHERLANEFGVHEPPSDPSERVVPALENHQFEAARVHSEREHGVEPRHSPEGGLVRPRVDQPEREP